MDSSSVSAIFHGKFINNENMKIILPATLSMRSMRKGPRKLPTQALPSRLTTSKTGR